VDKIPNLPTQQSNVYMFYGNPSATSQSDFNSVFTNWDQIFDGDEKITNHANNEGAWTLMYAMEVVSFLLLGKRSTILSTILIWI